MRKLIYISIYIGISTHIADLIHTRNFVELIMFVLFFISCFIGIKVCSYFDSIGCKHHSIFQGKHRTKDSDLD